jgi:hypothetical protein
MSKPNDDLQFSHIEHEGNQITKTSSYGDKEESKY